MTLTITEVRSPRDLRAFITLPRRLYRGMQGYAAPLDYDRRLLLDPAKSSFHAHGEAAYWIAREDGRDVGRISAQIDHLAVRPENADAGFFGCFDAIDSPEVIGALLRRAEAWIAARGRQIAQGPFSLSINGESGLLLEGQTAPPMMFMPWHPAYLARYLRQSGYLQVQTLLSFAVDMADFDSVSLEKLAARVDRGSDFQLRGLRTRMPHAEAAKFRTLYNDALSSNWGFAPLAESEALGLVKSFRSLVSTDCVVVAERNGEPIGLMIVLPNIAELTGGHPGVFGRGRLMWHVLRRRYRSARIVLMGVSARYRAAAIGMEVAVAMSREMFRRNERLGFSSAEVGWVLDSNKTVIKIVETAGFRRIRTLGVFEKQLKPEPAS